MMVLISVRRSFVIFVMIQLVQTRQVSYFNEDIFPSKIETATNVNAETDGEDTAQFTLTKIDNIVEKVSSILETNEFDVVDEVFKIAQELDIPYVSEVKFIFQSLNKIKERLRSQDVLRLMRHSFDYVKDSKLVQGIKHLKTGFTTCSNSPNSNKNRSNTTTSFNDLLYSCPVKSISQENVKVASVNTKFSYKCIDNNCQQQEIYSPVILEFDNGKHLRLTIDSYYRLSRKRNFYPMLLQLYELNENGINKGFQNSYETFFLTGHDIRNLEGEMLDSCIVSTYLKMYYTYFVQEQQPTFAVPNQLNLIPQTKYYWFKGSGSKDNGHWKGRQYWSGGYPDKCMRDYVDWSCPYFQNCWD